MAISEPTPVAPAAVSGAPKQLFARKSSGLVKGWSPWDAFRYAFYTINPIILGFWAFSLAPLIGGHGSLIWAVIISSGLMLLAVVTYGVLITLIPRAGGDYLYQTRILGGGIGFILTCAGVWFIMCHWAPIYAWSLVNEILQPLSTLIGSESLANWWVTQDGTFVGCLITIAVASLLVGIGMRRLAKVQSWCLWAGLVGMLLMIGLLLFNSQGGFEHAFNSAATHYYGAGPNAYQKTLAMGAYEPAGLGFHFSGTMLLIPLLLFWNVYVIWGAAMAGEVRGAGDFRRNIYAMGGAMLAALLLTLIFFALFAKTLGWDFYNSANGAFWNYYYEFTPNAPPMPAFPDPVMLSSFLTGSGVLRFLVVALNGLFIVGFIGTLFLTSTRMIFAAAFDRVLPEWAAKVRWGGVPVGALVLMIVPSLGLSILYSYGTTFSTYTLDAVLVLTIGFIGSAVSLTLLPWLAPGLLKASPFENWRFAGLNVTTIVGGALTIFWGLCVYAWLTNEDYGVNNPKSLRYMGALYVVAIAVYLVSRLVRRLQGVPVATAQGEIPVD
jgi:APA family basic amino acid/polyamine antiporter